jgi:hypothetical protein
VRCGRSHGLTGWPLPRYARSRKGAWARDWDPTSIRRILNLSGSIEQGRSEGFVGPASFWVDELTSLVEAGMDAFMFWPAHDEEQQIEAFAEEVIPAVREAVAAKPRNGRIAG